MRNKGFLRKPRRRLGLAQFLRGPGAQRFPFMASKQYVGVCAMGRGESWHEGMA